MENVDVDELENEVMQKLHEIFTKYKTVDLHTINANPKVPENIKIGDLTWVQKTGEKGPYELCNQANTPEFKELADSLQGSGGRGFKAGMFYWLFQDGRAIGRKTVKAKQ